MKKQVLFSLFVVLFLFFISFLFAFIWNQKEEKNKKPLVVNFDLSEVIYFNNKLPLSDVLGKKMDNKNIDNNIQGYVNLLIKNPNNFLVEYDIYLTKRNIQYSSIKDEYVKFYVTDGKDRPCSGYRKNKIPSYADLLYLSDKPNSRLIYHGSLSKNSSQSFKIRSWLSDSYGITDYIEEFSADINVRIK